MRVTYHRKVERHLIESRPTWTIKVFLDAFEVAIERIRRSPEMFGIVRGTIRCATVPPFEYGIYDRIVPDRVRVQVVKHLARNPG